MRLLFTQLSSQQKHYYYYFSYYFNEQEQLGLSSERSTHNLTSTLSIQLHIEKYSDERNKAYQIEFSFLSCIVITDKDTEQLCFKNNQKDKNRDSTD